MTGEQFAAWRNSQGLTQAQAARVFRVNVRTIQNYESLPMVPVAFEAATVAWSHGWRPDGPDAARGQRAAACDVVDKIALTIVALMVVADFVA